MSRSSRETSRRSTKAGRVSMLALVVGATLALSACSQWGYVFADQATAPGYTPNANDSLKSSGAPTTINRTGIGTYVVHFTGLTSTGGVVHVTPHSASDAICTVGSWDAVSGGVDAAVDCFGTNGHPLDTTFDAILAAPQPASFLYAQLWAQNATAPIGVPYNPDAAHSLNSTGSTNTVTHTSTGNYIAGLPLVYTDDIGNVKVTANATTAVVCNPEILAPNGNAGLNVSVSCFNASGTAIDAAFTLTWTSQNLLGVTRPSADIAYFTAGGAASSFNSTGGPNTVVEVSAGVFTVTFGGLAGPGGDVQAQLFSGLAGTGAPGSCTVASWRAVGADEVADVRCFGTAGTPADPIVLLAHFVR
jgi:hypothetical protein